MSSNFQLPIAVTLAGTGLLSLAFHRLSASERGKIALPITSDGPLESRPDPFDVTLPEDIIDGEPIDEASFWVNVSSQSAYPFFYLFFYLRQSSGGHCLSLLLLSSYPFRLYQWAILFHSCPQPLLLPIYFMSCFPSTYLSLLPSPSATAQFVRT